MEIIERLSEGLSHTEKNFKQVMKESKAKEINDKNK